MLQKRVLLGRANLLQSKFPLHVGQRERLFLAFGALGLAKFEHVLHVRKFFLQRQKLFVRQHGEFILAILF
jgi:hypothetical protein